MAKWWQNDMADAGQLMYTDPATALSVATMPQAVLQGPQLADPEAVEEAGKSAREQKTGFLGKLGGMFTGARALVEFGGSKVPGFGVFKNVAETMWMPVDKLASSAYWLYSEVVSQPLTTAFLVSGRAKLTGEYGEIFEGKTWSDAYGEAETISPGQAVANYGATTGMVAGQQIAEGGGVGGVIKAMTVGAEAGRMTADDGRKMERLLYDTEYWRNKVGWTYTAGTGAIDFTVSFAADPAYPVLLGAAKVVKGVRHAQVVQPGQKPKLFEKAPEDVATSKRANEFYDWAAERRGKAAEIAAHPIFGKLGSRRRNDFASQYGDILAHTSRDEMPLILRFALADESAMSALGGRSLDLGLRLGRLNENRSFLSSAKFDPEVLAHFVDEEQAGRLGIAGLGGPGVGGVSPATAEAGAGAFPRLLEPPYPRPVEPGPRQAGWDATYGHLAQQARLYRGAAGEVISARRGMQPKYFGQSAVTGADLKAAETWRRGQVDAMDAELNVMRNKEAVYSSLLGENFGKSIEDITPGTAHLFGSMKQMYRMGPAAQNVAKIGDKAVRKMGSGRGDWATEGGLTSKVLRNGFYQAPVRFVQSFGERIPEGFVNHVADEAPTRVGDFLKQVRGLSPEDRIGMLNEYTAAPDKMTRSKVLENIHGAIIHHYGRAHNLDPEVTQLIADMTRDGIAATMMKLTGSGPSKELFGVQSAVEGGAVRKVTGEGEQKLVTLTEEGEGLVLLPTAKTHLSQGDALLPIREIERFFDRHSGYLQGAKKFVGSKQDYIRDEIDGLAKVWKASTLLRPAYAVRTVSDEAAVAAVKFGMLSSIAGLGEGGWNFLRNRPQELSALILGRGSYVPTTGKGAKSVFARVAIDDPKVLEFAKEQGLKTERIRVSNAWPIVDSRIKTERALADEADKMIKQARAKGEDASAFLAAKADHEAVVAQYTDYLHDILRNATDSTGRRLAIGAIEYKGVRIPEVFSGEWQNPITRDQISSSKAADFLFAQGESIDNGRLIKTGDWTPITPDKTNHMESWLNGINNQFRQDDLYRLVASDDSLKTASKWLKTPEGKYHLSQLGAWADQPGELLKAIKLTLDSYLPKGTGLQQKLANNEQIFEEELRAAMRPEDFPTVHGEELKALTARFTRETATRRTNEIISKGYEFLGGIPSDLLVRHPTFNKAYQVRIKELVDQHQTYRKSVGGEVGITPKEMEKFYEQATRLAKKDISQVVYDPHRTTASEALRFIFPFLSAHGDSLQRWAGIIGEKPQALAGISKIYNAPVAANLVTDEHGNHVSQDGYSDVTDPVTGEIVDRKFVSIQERVLHLRLPWDTKNQNEWMKENVWGYGIPIKIQAMNTILPGDPWFNPGTGPLVQVPASAIAKKSPQVGDFLQWAKVLPYGPSGGVVEIMAPKYMRSAWDAFTTDDPDNEKYQAAYLATYNRQIAEHAEGGPAPDLKKVEKEAKQFMFLQALTAWASPAQTKETPLSGTHYQFFVDQYKKLQEAGPVEKVVMVTDPATGQKVRKEIRQSPQDIFLATYGSDYFGFTASLSKSIGVAPSIVAMTQAGEFKDMIDKDPEMAAWLVGEVYNQGSFSSSVYRKQMETMMGGKPMREKIGALQSIRDNQVDLGWSEYMRAKGYIDASLIQAGFHSYEQAGAENFKLLKERMIGQLATQYPEWDKERGIINTRKIPSRIAFFKKALQDKRIQSDTMRFETPALAVYLQSRDMYKSVLSERGAKSLSFAPDGTPIGENADIGYAWRQTQLGILNSNTAFQDTFNRYLENDDLS